MGLANDYIIEAAIEEEKRIKNIKLAKAKKEALEQVKINLQKEDKGYKEQGHN